MKPYLVAFLLVVGCCLRLAAADSFGSGTKSFAIDFVTVENHGNADDAGAGGGLYSSPHGGVAYIYRISKTEIGQDMVEKSNALGNLYLSFTSYAGSPRRPITSLSWNEAARFVNWLNISKGHQPAYKFAGQPPISGGYNSQANIVLWQTGESGYDAANPYRNKNAYYFLPSENEWYKAAYHKNDGATANYWDYATGSNNPPTPVTSGTNAGTAVYNGAGSFANIDEAGGLSSYGTMGQNGNVWEWTEGAFTAPNDSVSETRLVRGGQAPTTEATLRPTSRSAGSPAASYGDIGFRVASAYWSSLQHWRSTNFGSPENLDGGGDSSDTDGDSIPNLLEYAFGTNPKVANAMPLLATTTINRQLQISFSCDASHTDVSYIVQTTTNLAGGIWQDIAKSTGSATMLPVGNLCTVLDSGSGLRTITVTESTGLSGISCKFIRLKVTNP